MTPRISILMPVYNNGDYVAEAIESMLGQTFSDFELIVLDDCSTDHSQLVIESFKDKRIVYHRNEKNIGLANNLNVGLDLARGEFIARMDGDDISLPERLQTQLDFLDKHPDIDLCSCGLEKFGKETGTWIRESDPEQVKITMMFYSPVLHASSVWRRTSFEKHGLRYRQEAFPAEDYDLWARAVFHCKLVNIPDVLYRYRIHGIQVTKTDDRVEVRDRQIRLEFLRKALPSLKSNVRDEFINKYLNRDKVTLHDSKTLKFLYRTVDKANQIDNFFDQKLLHLRLKKYYQFVVFSLINENEKLNNIEMLFELSLKQIIKLYLQKMMKLVKIYKRNKLKIYKYYIQKTIDKKFLKSIQKGKLAVNIKNDLGFGAKIIWVLELLLFCEEKNLKPYFKFSYKEPQVDFDYYSSFFVSEILPSSQYLEIETIGQLKLGKDYNKLLTIRKANNLIVEKLIVKNELLQQVDNFYIKHLKDYFTLGIHYRGTDKINEACDVRYEKVLKVINHCMNMKQKFSRIFVSTDDNNFLDYLSKTEFSNLIVINNDSFRSNNKQSIHSRKNLNKYEINKDALINILLLSKCDFLIKSTSIMSAISLLINPDIPYVMLNKPYDDFLYFPEKILLENSKFDVENL